ncbi:MAG TPA: alpha-amylase family glycosyl hydrolase [Caproicibacter sp.]|nr:alpha-amylase family glycosyl hydrolase [Caproicibacter sp.]
MQKKFVRLTALALSAFIFISSVGCTAKQSAATGSSNVVNSNNIVNAGPKKFGFTWDNASVYFLLTDRFCNGNTSNDHSYGRSLDQNGKPVSGWEDSAGSFHGGDFAGITQKIKEGYFDKLGVNAIWITPPFEQVHGCRSMNGYAFYAFHGYWTLDFTQPDANYGTKEEFKKMVDTAHEHGIRIVMDVILNHPGYTTMKDADEYGFGQYNDGWKSYYYGSESNLSTQKESSFLNLTSNLWNKWWGSSWVRAAEGFAGYDTGDSSDTKQCVSGLPDFKNETTNSVELPQLLKTKWQKEGRLSQEQKELSDFFKKNNLKPTVLNYEIKWLTDWVRDYGIDGFRCDTAKHVDRSAWAKLKEYCQKALDTWRKNNPKKVLDNTPFWTVGEVYGHGVEKDDYFTDGKFNALINFSFRQNVMNKSNVPDTYDYMSKTLRSEKNFNVLSYISSHDDALFPRSDLIHGGDYLLMAPGAVQIYYGDETARPRQWKDLQAQDLTLRSNMNWSSIDQKTLTHWQILGKFRDRHPAVGAGTQTEISRSPFIFARKYTAGTNIDKVIVAFTDADKNIDISTKNVFQDGETVRNAYDNKTTTVKNGKVTFQSGVNGTILVEECD